MKIRNVALQDKIKSTWHHGAQAPLNIVLRSGKEWRGGEERSVAFTVRAAMNESDREVGIISSVSYYFFFYIISFPTFPLFNIVLAHVREEEKNEARSKIFIYDRLANEVHVGHLCSPVLTRTALTWLASLMQSPPKSLMPPFSLSDRDGWKEETNQKRFTPRSSTGRDAEEKSYR